MDGFYPNCVSWAFSFSLRIKSHSSFLFEFASIANVTLDSGIYLAGSRNNIAFGVETCRCSNPYNGTSCQDPADGYYRWTSVTTTGTEEYTYEQFVGKSIKCNCNGRSERCNKETGQCEVSIRK